MFLEDQDLQRRFKAATDKNDLAMAGKYTYAKNEKLTVSIIDELCVH